MHLGIDCARKDSAFTSPVGSSHSLKRHTRHMSITDPCISNLLSGNMSGTFCLIKWLNPPNPQHMKQVRQNPIENHLVQSYSIHPSRLSLCTSNDLYQQISRHHFQVTSFTRRRVGKNWSMFSEWGCQVCIFLSKYSQTSAGGGLSVITAGEHWDVVTEVREGQDRTCNQA